MMGAIQRHTATTKGNNMRRLYALLTATALAASACSGSSDSVSDADLGAATTAPLAVSDAEPATTRAAEPEPLAAGVITVETAIEWGTDPLAGTFEVTAGDDVLGCSAGTVLEHGGPGGITNQFTCELGARKGSFTIGWQILEGAEGPGAVNGPWTVISATGDYAGLIGEGLWSGTGTESTGYGSFPGEIEFGVVDDVAAAGDGSVDLATRLGDVWIPDEAGSVLVAVVESDGSMSHAARTADSENPAIGPDDRFRVGSVTKMFTSVLTLGLVENGLVDLDAPAGDYISRIDLPEGVTVRQLLQHRSGIANYTVGEFFEQTRADDSRVWTAEEVVAVIADEPAQFEPGAEFGYSNTNYILLGVLIEEVTGETYDAALRARIIDPLGLGNTFLSVGDDEQDVAPAHTAFFTDSLALITEDYTAIATGAWSAGALVSSPADMHTFLTALFGNELMNEDLLAEMTSGSDDYGLGISTEWPEFGEQLLGHGGSIIGFNTMVLHAPETGRTGFWVTTSDYIDPHPLVASTATLLEDETA
jgi:D-alanyl-D-alanine carboxypeptidase